MSERWWSRPIGTSNHFDEVHGEWVREQLCLRVLKLTHSGLPPLLELPLHLGAQHFLSCEPPIAFSALGVHGH